MIRIYLTRKHIEDWCNGNTEVFEAFVSSSTLLSSAITVRYVPPLVIFILTSFWQSGTVRLTARTDEPLYGIVTQLARGNCVVGSSPTYPN